MNKYYLGIDLGSTTSKAVIINEKDEWLLKPQFDKIYAVNNKFIRAKKGNLFSFIEVANFKISSEYYDYVTDYVNGIAAVWEYSVHYCCFF